MTGEIVMASESGCPIEMHKIEVEKCDEMYDKDCSGERHIPFHRAAYDRSTGQSPNSPREQVGLQETLSYVIPSESGCPMEIEVEKCLQHLWKRIEVAPVKWIKGGKGARM